ncbi:mechanosensitive ion channel family protein [Autumnicola edwardsiae]|uniref:Mechanosensitive ion channel n=1 Tax=Autumnicola edwardsiae TaxID=3075594 RepID=A0ABU3CSK4_9FLAO|nr:mechanosensitive ion channel domain-containing protein [Zunongwangia sp. F297]MDT0649334.1 mechanosensitive ion channel [Zunongwangia sp. F297]
MNFNQNYKNLFCLVENVLVSQGVNTLVAIYINLLVNLSILFLLILLTKYVIRRFVVETFKTFTDKTKTTFDDFLLESNFPKDVGQIVPLLLIYYSIPYIFADFHFLLKGLLFLFNIYVIILAVWIVRSLIRTSRNYLMTREEYGDKPIESYSQVVLIILWVIGFMFIFAEVTGRSVISFAISLGAASAVLLLVFKDTILGFVASIQVSVNDIVRIGDWITFSKYGADGNVTEINLATVRVQNWDNTFTTIPTYSLISDSFQNWRGMQESPGRRIKRAIYIKQSSVKFLNQEDLQEFRKIKLVSGYIEHRQAEIDVYNNKNNIDKSLYLNGRNQTNLGVFRKYADAYLHEHSAINKDLYIIVRQLAPTAQGLPLEILCFSKDKRWENFEYITADIFDHLIAAVPFFDLKLFEAPSGDDIKNIKLESTGNAKRD